MSASWSKFAPQQAKAETSEDLQNMLLKLQAATGQQLGMITIYYDGKNHVAWFYTSKPRGFLSGG